MTINSKSDPYVLEGRIVTMSPAGVIDDGRVYIREQVIVDVRERRQARPEGFSGAPVVKVGGTIFPGLIELHNHLSYNAIPLWDAPKRYAHSGSWQGTDAYKVAITKPAQVLANTAGNAEALIRFVECRCLLGGVTTSQGLTLSSRPGIQSAYKGLVRNVESPLVDALPAARARIGAPDRDLDAYEAKLERVGCYLQHLSEGLGATPRRQFTRLQRPDGSWALHHSLCGVHSTALTDEDFQVFAQDEHQCSIVWSPLSNLLLYGGTTKVKAAKAAGVPIALGSDWGPSGTKNLLGELKVAWLVSEEQNGLFTDFELCEMVTTTPAKILGWDHLLGSIEAGKLADLIVIDDTTKEPFRQLIEARETSLTFVVIGGVPRLGQKRMMHRFGSGTEEIQVGASHRVLDLTPDVAEDPTRGITLGVATERLRDSLARLPELAEQLDAALGAGWVPGGELLLGGGQTLAGLGLPDDWQPPAFSVVLDFEDEDGALDPSFALGAGALADWVDSMELEGITVADDRAFFRKLARAGNLPSFIKTGLPPLHGRSVPRIPFLEAAGEGLDASLQASRDLHEALSEARVLRPVERLRILDQAILLLERYYVHLPMKRAMHAVDPVQRLRLLHFEIEQQEAEPLRSDLEFHAEVASILHAVRDLHTTYRLPNPYRRLVAWLPFLIEECEDAGGGSKFLVSKVVGDIGPQSFEVGVEVLYWNGTPMDKAVELLAREIPAGNAAARRARALHSLTVRPLARGLVPSEEWVVLTWRPLDSPQRTYELRQPWLVFEPSRRQRVLSPEDDVAAATTIGLDDYADDVHQAKKLLYAARFVEAEEAAFVSPEAAETTGGAGTEQAAGEIPSRLPTLFRARKVSWAGAGKARYGYLRIFSFNIEDADIFVEELERLLSLMPDEGLILDLRGNAGGLIPAAERALELFSPRPIEPERAQFLNSPANLELCRRHAPSQVFTGFSLKRWIDSMAQAVATGATYSHGFPLTDPNVCNSRGQRYQGPVVLIVDGLCYSAADIFAAGFQDHGLGMILGLDVRTGAGGANVWSHAVLRQLAGPESGLRRLPGGADLRLAMRRTLRVGDNAGELLEDLGVQPDVHYRMQEEDLLEDNCGLIRQAVKMLDAAPRSHLMLTREDTLIRIRTKNVQWLEVRSRKPAPVPEGGALEASTKKVVWRSHGVVDVVPERGGGAAILTLDELPQQRPLILEVVGMRQDEPVVRARLEL